MTDTWEHITPRFSIGWAWGAQVRREGFCGLGVTYYWTPRRRHHKVFIHILFFRLVLAWHRRLPATSTTSHV
mgnify:CR=1 FL=1